MDFMEGMSISALEVDYSFDSSNRANKFVLSGDLQLGLLGLDMTYVNDGSVPGQKQWPVDANLGSSDGMSANLASIISSILGPDTELLSILPNFVQNISIAPTSGTFDSTTSPVQLSVRDTNGYIIFLLRIALIANRVTHLSPIGISSIKHPNANSTNYYYSYHYTNSCTSGEADNTLCHGRLPFGPFHPASGSDDVVLVAGHHFMVIANGGVTLHYMFSSQSEQPNSPPAAGTTAPTPALAPSPAPTSAPTPTPTPATATTLQTSPWPWYLCTSRLAHCRSQTWAFSTKTVLCG